MSMSKSLMINVMQRKMQGNKKYNSKEDIKILVEQLLSGKYDPEMFSYDFPFDLAALSKEDLDSFGDDYEEMCYVCSMFETDIDPNDPNMVGMYDSPAFLKFFQEMYDKYLKD